MRITYTRDHFQRSYIIQIVIDDEQMVGLPIAINLEDNSFIKLSTQLNYLAAVAKELEDAQQQEELDMFDDSAELDDELIDTDEEEEEILEELDEEQEAIIDEEDEEEDDDEDEDEDEDEDDETTSEDTDNIDINEDKD